MNFVTINHWDQEIWNKASVVYQQAFGEIGAKSEKIIRNMFAKNICFLHVLLHQDEVIGMALTGKAADVRALIIDYIAIEESYRKQGIGQQLLNEIKKWARNEVELEAIIIEVEAEKTMENLDRIEFWKKNDFILTEYVHQYIWVPEPYSAMYCKLTPDTKLPIQGEALFQYILNFHKQSFSLINKS